MFPVDRRLAAASVDSAIAVEGAAAALQALTELVAAATVPGAQVSPDRQVPDTKTFAHGAGAVLATVRLAEHACCFLLNHDCIAAVADAAKPQTASPLAKVNLKKALAASEITLEVGLGGVEVNVGSLLGLQVGDVIRLQSSVDKPLPIYAPSAGGEHVFGGHLGIFEKMIAIEVVRREK
jgi:flagellar motor switch/type III secretory pathway protein FliN